MIVEDYDVDYSDDDEAFDAAPLLTKSYGACAGAARLRLDPPDPKRRRRRGYLRLLTGLGCALMIGGVLHVVFRLGPYRGKERWRRRGYRHATHAPTPARPSGKGSRRGHDYPCETPSPATSTPGRGWGPHSRERGRRRGWPATRKVVYFIIR